MADDVHTKRDLRQELTDKFVAALDAGKIPWERPWTAIHHGSPRNGFSNRNYSGGNRLFLSLAMLDSGWSDPRFGTFNQIRQAGGMVKKGEHGIPIELWRERPFWERRDVTVLDGVNAVRVKGPGATPESVELAGGRTVAKARLRVEHGGNKLSWQGAELTLTQRVSQVHVVFNVAQTEGLELEPLPSADHGTAAHERVATIQAAMERDGLQFGIDPKQAYYLPSKDTVYLPPVEAFHSQEGHAGTLLHEIGHATGAAQRLGREGIVSVDPADREKYAREELRAEIFSAFMAAETGIPWDRSQHESYVQSWSEALKKDKNEIFRAAADAGKAVDYVLAKEQSLQVALEREASAKASVLAADVAKPEQTLHQALEDAGWKFQPQARTYEKMFILEKDKNKGGEFTRGRSEIERILNARSTPQGLVLVHGWEEVPVPGTVGATPEKAARLLDSAAKERLTKTEAHLGIQSVRGRDETPASDKTSEPMPQQSKRKAIEIDAPAAWGSALVNRDESGLGQSEAACVKDWVDKQGIGWPVSMSDQTFMGRHEGLLTEMATYTFLVPEKDIERAHRDPAIDAPSTRARRAMPTRSRGMDRGMDL
ncbi:uncharacterized protein E1O_19560 [Burkholderiales bacterium GJ-E10]|nr:uncharacterized protein E1O_19560 [Burkholderiales bacterium GJ-E10]